MCFILVLWFPVIEAAADVHLEFLRNQTDVLNRSRVFAIFCCNIIEGPNLSWEIRGEGIGVFDLKNDLDRVIARNRSDYGYLATVLSRRRTGSRLYNFDSVLIVSIPNDSYVEVNCVSNSAHASISNRGTPGHEINGGPRGTNFLVMLPILTNATIVRNVSTRAFFCASSSQDQLWATNANDYIRFDSDSMFGSHRGRRTTSTNSLRLQAICLGQQNQQIVSILYVTDDVVSSVQCSDNRISVKYPDDFKIVSGMQWLMCDLLVVTSSKSLFDCVQNVNVFFFKSSCLYFLLDQAWTITGNGNAVIPSTDNSDLFSVSGSFKIAAIPNLMAASLMMMFVLVA